MTLIQALGPSATTLVIFFGVLTLSLVAVLVTLLSDY